MCVCDICLPGIAHIAKPQCLKSAVSVASTAEATCCAVWTFLVRVCLAARIVSRTIALLYIAQIEMQIHKHNIISYSTCGSQLTAQLRLTATFAMAGQPQPLAGLQSMRMDYSCFHFLWARTMAIFGHARVSQELRCRLPSESPQVIDCDPTAMARPFGAKADDDAGDDVVS